MNSIFAENYRMEDQYEDQLVAKLILVGHKVGRELLIAYIWRL